MYFWETSEVVIDINQERDGKWEVKFRKTRCLHMLVFSQHGRECLSCSLEDISLIEGMLWVHYRVLAEDTNSANHPLPSATGGRLWTP